MKMANTWRCINTGAEGLNHISNERVVSWKEVLGHTSAEDALRIQHQVRFERSKGFESKDKWNFSFYIC